MPAAHNPVAPGQWFRYSMPYQFVRLSPSGRAHIYLPLNRNYKPLGIMSKDWVVYENYRFQAMQFSSDPHAFDGRRPSR